MGIITLSPLYRGRKNRFQKTLQVEVWWESVIPANKMKKLHFIVFWRFNSTMYNGLFRDIRFFFA